MKTSVASVAIGRKNQNAVRHHGVIRALTCVFFFYLQIDSMLQWSIRLYITDDVKMW